MRVLSILLWKHLKERQGNIAHSVCEIGTGVLVFVILLLVKQILVQDIEKMEKISHDIRMVDVLYAPKNQLSEQMMFGVCSELFDINSTFYGIAVQCKGFKTEKEMNNYVSHHKFPGSEAVIVVVFQNLDDEDFPDNLNYSIHFVTPKTYNTTRFNPFSRSPLVIENNATLFANIQWRIDKSYMNNILREDIDHEVKFESQPDFELPHVRGIHELLALCSVIGPMPFFMTTHACMVDEKRSGIKALLKLSGVKPILIHIAHLIDTAMFATIYGVLVVILLFITKTPILKYSNPIIIWFTTILQFLTITSFSFITSSMSQNNQHSDSLAILFYLMTFLINLLWGGAKFGKSFWLTVIYIVLPHAPVFMFWNDVVASEAIHEGTMFKNIYKSHRPNDASCVLVVWVLLLVQLTLVLLMSWYLELVRPGQYGVALAWHFIFHKKFWSHFFSKRGSKKVNFHVSAERKTKILHDVRFFEPKPKGAKIAIKIANVTKVNKHESDVTTVVDQIDLDVYRKQITVLLGISGAGKSCLTSIITGMCSATSGHVYVNGLDIEARLHDLRGDLAYCPVRDMTFDYMTVEENLYFFQYLREFISGEKNTKVKVDDMMTVFHMNDMAKRYSRELSAGYKRCLQIACMLLSDAEVLVLDEPSNGMDAGMKHRLWDVLLTLRKQNTILMTSKCMQEADALGDRIALMSNGRLKCYASPEFLKNAIGADVEVQLRLSDVEGSTNIEEEIHRIIAEAEMTELDTTVSKVDKFRVSIRLPVHQRDHFPKVFDVLEHKRKELGIMSIDVGVSLEDLFLRFVEEEDDLEDGLQIHEQSSEKRLKGWRLTKLRLNRLIKRAWIHVWGFKYQYMIVQVLVPLIAFIIITIATNASGSSETIDDDDDEDVINNTTHVLYQPLGRDLRTDGLDPNVSKSRFSDITFRTSVDVKKEIHKLNHETYQESGRGLQHFMGIKTGWNQSTIYYPLRSAPDLPKAVNVFSNMFMSMIVPRSHAKTISVTFESNPAQKGFVPPKNLYLCYCWSIWITFLVIIPLGPFIRLCIEEFNSGVRFHHLLMGCSATIIWLSKLLAHLAIYVAVVPWSILLVAFFLDADETFNHFDFLGSLFLLLLVFGPAHLLHWYVLSFKLSNNRPIARMYIISLCLGLITPIFVFFLSEINQKWPFPLVVFLYILYILANFVPAFTFSVGVAKISKVARNNAYCKLNYHLCPNMVEDLWIPKNVCCISDGHPFGYFTNFHTGLVELIVLLSHMILYWSILLMLQRRCIQTMRDRLLNCLEAKTVESRNKKIDVMEEEEYVKTKIGQYRALSIEDRQLDENVILAKNLHKLYGTNNAVRNVSFSVKKGECLAIFGQTGAGKTTTLGMLTGFVVQTSGETVVNGYFYQKNRCEYLRSIAWCTERGLDEFLSGLQNLELLATLFGYTNHDAFKLSMRYLQYMGLTRYLNSPFSSYSTGCKHRLSFCSALVCAPKAALLDGLCANMDPYSRPLINRAIQRLLAKNTAIVIAEESLEWHQIDDWCNRIAFLDNGELIAIGTVKDIRRDYATGHTVTIKLKVDMTYQVVEEDTTTSMTSLLSGKSMKQTGTVAELKAEFLSIFQTSILVDEHMTMLYFHIRDPNRTIEYSFMFQNLENLAKKYVLIEDYILTETTIDEILCRLSLQKRGNTEQRRTSLQIFSKKEPE